MNPKIKISVDQKNKAATVLEGMVTVNAKVDVEVTGIDADDVVSWAQTDKFTGKSLRLRIVDPFGHDLARFPIHEKTSTSNGDTWTVDGDTFSCTDFSLYTDKLRDLFLGFPYDGVQEFGLILDSTVDDAQYAIGKIKLKNWATASDEDPTILPDWREVEKTVLQKARDAATSAANASTSETNAAASATTASNKATAAGNAQTAAEQARDEANVYANGDANTNGAKQYAASAEASAGNAQTYAGQARTAVGTYPVIGTNGKWWYYVGGVLTDSGVSATGPNGVTPHIGGNGNWYIGDTDTGTKAQGPKGDAGTTAWSGITGKPETFTPSSHNHTKSEITDLPQLSTVATSGSYADLSNKPTNVSAFTNDAGYLTSHQDITGKQDKLTAGTGIRIEGTTISSTAVGGVSSVNNKTGAVTLSASDVGALAANGKAADAVKADSASSVTWSGVTSKPEWIGSTKPTYTADEVGALPDTGGTIDGNMVELNVGTTSNTDTATLTVKGFHASLVVGDSSFGGDLSVGGVNVMTAIGGKVGKSDLPYPIAVTSGALSDRTVNTTTANSLTLPAAIANKARDLVLVLDLSDEPEAQTISISPATGETIQLLTDATDTFSAEAGKVNILYFTEITSGKFLVTRKAVS